MNERRVHIERAARYRACLGLLAAIASSLSVAVFVSAARATTQSPAGAVPLITQVFAVDTNAHLVEAVSAQASSAESSAATGSMTASAAGAFQTLVSRDREDATQSREITGHAPWDKGSTSVTVDSQHQVSATAWTLTVDVEQAFHLTGNSSAESESLSATRYSVTVSNSSGALRITQITNLEASSNPQPTAGAPAVPIEVGKPMSHAEYVATVKALRSGSAIASTARRRGKSLRAPLRAHAAGAYNWQAAKAYAKQYWYNYNPNYASYENDCQNFASQVITAGGEPWFGSIEGDWYPGQYPWYNVVGFYGFARSKTNYYRIVGWSELGAGDEIELGWNGSTTPDHAVVVDDYENGEYYIAAHTESRWHYPLSDEDAGNTNLWFVRPLYG